MSYKKTAQDKLLERFSLGTLETLINRLIDKDIDCLKEKSLVNSDFEAWSDVYCEEDTDEEEWDNIFCSIYFYGIDIHPLDFTIYCKNNNVYCDDISDDIALPPELGLVEGEEHLAEIIAKRVSEDLKERLALPRQKP